MAKWQLNRPGEWDYPLLGFIATDGDILESDFAPDAFWDSVTDTGQAETVDRYPAHSQASAPDYTEPSDGAMYVWSESDNRPIWSSGANVVAQRPTPSLYLPTRMAGHRWRRKRAATLAGIERARVAIIGDSIAFGGGITGTTPPKNNSSWPGRLRAQLENEGLYGGGLVLADKNVRANPTWDDRLTFGGTITDHAFGFYSGTSYVIAGTADKSNYVEFTEYCDQFVIYNLSSTGSINHCTVDGGADITFRNVATGGATPTYEKEPGYAPSQIVTIIPCGSLGPHTLRITGSTNVSFSSFLLGIGWQITGNGKIEVCPAAQSGQSMGSLFSNSGANDEINGLYGLPMIDMLKSDLLINALGINDWQGNRTLTAVKSDITTLAARQGGIGNAPTGAPMANGDFALLWNPQPDLTVLGTSSPQSWGEWESGWFDASSLANCPLVSLGERWIDYSTGNSAGYFADTIHPNDDGALDFTAAVHEAIMHGI